MRGKQLRGAGTKSESEADEVECQKWPALSLRSDSPGSRTKLTSGSLAFFSSI